MAFFRLKCSCAKGNIIIQFNQGHYRTIKHLGGYKYGI